MALAENNILRIKNYFRQGSIEALIVSFWQVNSISLPPTYAQACEAFAHHWAATGQNDIILHDSAIMYRTVMDNLSTPPEYGEFSEEVIGAGGGAPAPSFDAISLKQVVESRLTRAGYKRFPFIALPNVEGNDLILGPTVRLALEAFWGTTTSFLYTGDDFEVDFELTPVVVGRTLVAGSETEYELDLSKINLVTQAQLQGITSQNTRKT